MNQDDLEIKRAITRRNRLWQNVNIPKWVNLDKTQLDQFFTNSDIAAHCCEEAFKFLEQEGISLDDCLFIEPAAGNGAFLKFLPPAQRIGIDICPMDSEVKEADFLTWRPEIPHDKKLIYIGNPPFGYRGWLALQFVNQCAINSADYVFFILPMSFQSIGKGSPRIRVKGLTLEYFEKLPIDSYHRPDGKNERINSLWTIWKKGNNVPPQDIDFSDVLDLFTVDMRKERLCGQEKMKTASFFLQRTFYDTPPKTVDDFQNVKYVCGYGFSTKQQNNIIRSIIDNTDWKKYSNLAAHNCHHISMYHIKQALLDGGLKNA